MCPLFGLLMHNQSMEVKTSMALAFAAASQPAFTKHTHTSRATMFAGLIAASALALGLTLCSWCSPLWASLFRQEHGAMAVSFSSLLLKMRCYPEPLRACRCTCPPVLD